MHLKVSKSLRRKVGALFGERWDTVRGGLLVILLFTDLLCKPYQSSSFQLGGVLVFSAWVVLGENMIGLGWKTWAILGEC